MDKLIGCRIIECYYTNAICWEGFREIYEMKSLYFLIMSNITVFPNVGYLGRNTANEPFHDYIQIHS